MMATTMARQGGIGILHRFLTIEEEANQVLKVKRSGSVMIDNPYQISSEKSIEEAIDLMSEKEVSGLLVVDSDSKLVGILTERDVLFESITSKKIVSELMTKDVISSNENTSLDDAKDILKSHRIEKLPLVNDKNKIVGLYTTQDIMNIENFPNASKDKKGRPTRLKLALKAWGFGSKEISGIPSEKEINYLKAALADTPETFKQIQENAMGQLLTKAVSTGKLSSSGKLADIFKPNVLRNTLESYGDDTLIAMFGEERHLMTQKKKVTIKKVRMILQRLGSLMHTDNHF